MVGNDKDLLLTDTSSKINKKYFIKKLEKDLFPIDCNVHELSFLGVGIPLYLVFIKYCAIMLFILIITTGIHNLSSNYQII